MKIRSIVLASSFLISSAVIAETNLFVHNKTYALPSGKEVHVEVNERKCMPNECAPVDAGIWGVDGGKPTRVTELFRVDVDGKNFDIPEKFFRDLTNLHRVTVEESKGKLRILIRGGEAAGAFTAKFRIDGSCGFERAVCGEVCTEVWERTVWYNSFIYEAAPECKSQIY